MIGVRTTMRSDTLWLLVLALCLGGTIHAWQSPLPAFQRVSIQATSAYGADRSLSLAIQPGGGVEVRRASIDDLARVAFGFEHDPRPVEWRQGVGVAIVNPRGVRRDLYAITASAGREWTKPADGETVPTELRLMLRRLLEERFAMKARIDTRRTDVYALRQLANSRPTRPSLAPSANECLGPFMYGLPWAEDKPRCSFKNDGSGVDVGAATMAEFARVLSSNRALGQRLIIDETGLKGRFDVRVLVDIHYPTRIQQEFLGDVSSLDDRQPVAIREAMKKQLGLELREAKRSVPTLVIESARAPSGS